MRRNFLKPPTAMNNNNSANDSRPQHNGAGDSVEKAPCARSMIPALNLGSMTCSLAQLSRIENTLWFCLKTQPKHEHLAAIGLLRNLDIQCFSHRLRFRTPSLQVAVRCMDALLP